MARKPASRLKRLLLGVAYVAFACKLLIPAGYMPAALGAGSLLALCPGNLPVGLLDRAGGRGPHGGPGGHDHHGDDDAGEHDGAAVWEHCSLGALAATPALASACVVAVTDAAPPSIATTAPLVTPNVRPLEFRARAPPHLHA